MSPTRPPSRNASDDDRIPEQIAETAATLPVPPADPLTQAEARIQQLEADLHIAQVRTPIAERHGLNPSLAPFLRGDTAAELAADAADLAEQLRAWHAANSPTTTRPRRRTVNPNRRTP